MTKKDSFKNKESSGQEAKEAFRAHLKKLRDKVYKEAKDTQAKPIMAKVYSKDYPIIIEW